MSTYQIPPQMPRSPGSFLPWYKQAENFVRRNAIWIISALVLLLLSTWRIAYNMGVIHEEYKIVEMQRRVDEARAVVGEIQIYYLANTEGGALWLMDSVETAETLIQMQQKGKHSQDLFMEMVKAGKVIFLNPNTRAIIGTNPKFLDGMMAAFPVMTYEGGRHGRTGYVWDYCIHRKKQPEPTAAETQTAEPDANSP